MWGGGGLLTLPSPGRVLLLGRRGFRTPVQPLWDSPFCGPSPRLAYAQADAVTSLDQEGELVSPEEPDINPCQTWLLPSVTCGHPGCHHVASEMVASITEWRRSSICQAAQCTQLDLPSQPPELRRGFEHLSLPLS